MNEISSSRELLQAQRYVPKRLPSGELTLWEALACIAYLAAAFRLFILRQKIAFQAYRASWEYASHRPVYAGRHSKPGEGARGPRHAAGSSLLEQLGLINRFEAVILAIEDGAERHEAGRVERAARIA